MAVSLMLLEIKGAPGEAQVAGYRDHIVVESFSWSVDAKTEEKATDDPVTKIDAKAMRIKKEFDRSSTVLREMMREDKPFTATLRFIDPASRGSVDKIDAVLEIRMLGCHIDRISMSAEDKGKSVSLSEDLTISYTTSATLSYRSYDPIKKVRGRATTAEVPTSEKEAGKTA
ncbi:type VI secretion system tube protein Hcp [Variovorax ginsengisoli]|uniref:Type VI protein secretion system component Hcp n=1 Tax=Variovorax ginsengisoli TaxID=363844 RepID=A0ABT9S9K7_9BURK|nr:type VI secretion system tube protein Hcp [Variovorax ginsengisoli]MDP9901043.1 type VI protein secretion system component Hcp [Variovorax ginsengisoli]